MAFHLPNFVWTIVNLMILYLILKKLLFKPVTKLLDQREQEIKEGLELSARNKEEADNIKQQFDKKMQEAYAEAKKVLEEAETRANNNYEKILSQAKEDANQIIKKAKEDMQNERQQILQELKSQIAGLALSAATKVIEHNMNTETNRKLVEEFINEKGVA